MSCGETISFDLIKPILVSWEAYGQPPCLPLVYSTRSCRWQRADTGMTCATRSRRSLRSTAWSRGWDLRLTTSRSRYSGDHGREKHPFLPRPSGIINHHVGNFWELREKQGEKAVYFLSGRVSPGWRDGAQLKSRKQTQDRPNLYWSLGQRYTLQALKWDSTSGVIELIIQAASWQRRV